LVVSLIILMISSYGPGAAGSSAVFGRLIARFQRKYQAFRDLAFGSAFLYEFASWKLVSNGGKDRRAGIEGRSSRPIAEWRASAAGPIGLPIIWALLADGWIDDAGASRDATRCGRTAPPMKPVYRGPGARSRQFSRHRPRCAFLRDERSNCSARSSVSI